MTWRLAFFLLLMTFIIVNCSRKALQVPPDRVRTWNPKDVSSFHPAITIKLGWVPYEDQEVVQTGDFEWKVVQSKGGDDVPKAVPILFIESAMTEESLMVEMNIENELLGKLIKHSAMTQQPIQRPFVKFFEEAKCESCHPADIPVDFDK